MTGAAPWTTAAWAMLCAALGAAVTLELTGGLEFAPEVTAAPPAEPSLDRLQEPLEFEPPSRDGLEEIIARPLFSPSRRPVVAVEQAAAPAPVEALPSLVLIGVLLTEHQQAALMQPADGGEPSWVREGGNVQGWRIEKIERSRVLLRSNDRLDTVELRPDTAVPADARPKPRRARTKPSEEASDEEASDEEAARAPRSDAAAADSAQESDPSDEPDSSQEESD
jgi:hypothetical protein